MVKIMRIKLQSLIRWLQPFSFLNVFFYSMIFVVMCLFISFLVIFFFGDGNSTQPLTLLAVGAALLTLVYNVRRHISEDYCKEARAYLEKAYDTLKPSKPGDPPINDRLLWLTSARMLKTSENLSNKILFDSHRDAYIEDRQYWRTKFWNIIKSLPSEYYAEKPEHLIMHNAQDRAPLAESSLYVIYKFMEWPKDYQDPLDNYRFTDEEIETMQVRGPRGLGDLLAKHRELRKKK